MWKSLAVLLVVLAANGCATVVRCGVGTLAVPDGVDPDGPGFFVSQDGDDYVDGDGDRYEEVTCRPVTPVTLCGARTQAKAAEARKNAIKSSAEGMGRTSLVRATTIAQPRSSPRAANRRPRGPSTGGCRRRRMTGCRPKPTATAFCVVEKRPGLAAEAAV